MVTSCGKDDKHPSDDNIEEKLAQRYSFAQPTLMDALKANELDLASIKIHSLGSDVKIAKHQLNRVYYAGNPTGYGFLAGLAIEHPEMTVYYGHDFEEATYRTNSQRGINLYESETYLDLKGQKIAPGTLDQRKLFIHRLSKISFAANN
jgi:hypothetical protein